MINVRFFTDFVVFLKERLFKFTDKEVEMRIEGEEVAPIEATNNENEQQGDSDESHQICQAIPEQMSVNDPVTPVQENGSANLIKREELDNTKSQVQASASCTDNEKRGKELDFIESNHLEVNIDNIVEQVYRYVVEIQMMGPKTLHTKVFMKFLADWPAPKPKIAFDDDKMIAFAPYPLNIGKKFSRSFRFTRQESENDWKKSKPSKNIRLIKSWDCTVSIRPARKFTIPIKRALNG